MSPAPCVRRDVRLADLQVLWTLGEVGMACQCVEDPLSVAWIHLDQAKAWKAILVPLNSVAMGVLLRQVGKHPARVFSWHGKPVAWTGALKRAGIEDFRWHDLRHTWASWLAQQGTPLNVLQELGGWESESMVRRYAHLSQPVLIEHSELAATMLNGTTGNKKGQR